MWTRILSLLELYSYDQVIQNNGSTISSFLFKSSSEFLICCTLKNSSSSSFCYNFASHACNLGSHITFFLSFDSFQVTIQHATIVVHGNYWNNFKSSPRFLHLWYSCRTWVITKTFPVMQDMNGTSVKTFLTCGIKLQRHLQRMFNSMLVKLNERQTHFNHYLHFWRTR